jgi:2-dehydro-3-deoxygluconokinase
VELVAPWIVVVGEGMLELACHGEDWRLGYGGDTLNTAIHLARYGFPSTYLTALGSDAFSDGLIEAWSAEGLDTSFVLIAPERQPGLYAIRTDAAGERSFVYWREHSAARRMFDLPGSELILARAEDADLLIFSLISLAILPPHGRKRLLELGRRVRAKGGRVVFDGNYRPRLWACAEEARDARDAALQVCDIGLPSFEDEQALSGELDASMVAANWSAKGADEVVVKLSDDGCLVEGQIIGPPARLQPLDTSGAGDAFNAGYLTARLAGLDKPSAALVGHELAGWTLSRRGGIPQRDHQAPYNLPPGFGSMGS